MGNEFVMVPRVPTEEMIVSFAEAWYSKRQTIDDPDMLDAYAAMLAVAPEHQGEPVALPERDVDDIGRFTDGWNACLDEIAKLGPLYARPVQGEPVAWAIYFENNWLQNFDLALHAHHHADFFNRSNDCDLYNVRPLYTHADPGEVERLQRELSVTKKLYAEACQASYDFGSLRAQLAERDALLVDIRLSGLNDERSSRIDLILSSGAYADAINKHPSLRTSLDSAAIELALSASAEPSAPVDDPYDEAGQERVAVAAMPGPATEPHCKTCYDTGMVDDGEITCSEGGIPYENGPVKCVKDCPDCKPSAPADRDERADFDSYMRSNPMATYWSTWQARAALERKPSHIPFARQCGTLKIGIKGSAYDNAGTYRAYTYEEQPHNVEASKLGRAVSAAKPGGDLIDYGLSLLKTLQDEGFGVFNLNALERKS